MITIERHDKTTPDWVSDSRLYLDKDGNVVAENDPAKLTLLVAKGGSLPFATAQRYGLTVADTAPLAVAPVEPAVASEVTVESEPAAEVKPEPEIAPAVEVAKPEPKPAKKKK